MEFVRLRAQSGEPGKSRVENGRLASGRGEDAIVFDRERVKVWVSDLVEVEAARANQPVPAMADAAAQQSQGGSSAARNPVQQARQLGSRQGGEQRSDPMPRRKEGWSGEGFECSPFVLKSSRRQRFTVELYFASDVGALRHGIPFGTRPQSAYIRRLRATRASRDPAIVLYDY